MMQYHHAPFVREVSSTETANKGLWNRQVVQNNGCVSGGLNVQRANVSTTSFRTVWYRTNITTQRSYRMSSYTKKHLAMNSSIPIMTNTLAMRPCCDGCVGLIKILQTSMVCFEKQPSLLDVWMTGPHHCSTRYRITQTAGCVQCSEWSITAEAICLLFMIGTDAPTLFCLSWCQTV